MRKTILLIAVVFLTVSSFVHAQVTTQTAPAKRKFKYPEKVESKYDKAKDETSVFFNLIRIKGAENLDWQGTNVVTDERVDFSMYFTYPGQSLRTPKWVGIGIASAAYEPKQYGDYNLTIIADNERLNIGGMIVHNRGRTRYDARRPPVEFQMFEAAIPYEQFLQIANARKVKLQIGYREIPLDNENLEAIRDLASHTVP